MKATKVFLLDVRETSEVATGYIEGAVNIPVRTVMKNLDKLPADKTAPIIVIGGSGFRSGFTMTVLQMLGYTNVKNMSGGLGAWNSAGFPVVKQPTMN